MLRRLFIGLVCLGMVLPVFVSAQDEDSEAVKAIRVKIEGEQYLEALADLKPLIEEDAKNPSLYYLRGTAQFLQGDVESARTSHQAGMKSKNRYPFNYIGMARIEIKENNFEEANRLIQEKALYYDKGRDVNVKFAAAEAYIEGEKYKDAEVLLLQAQDQEPDNPKSYVALGDYYYSKGVLELAEDQYQKAVEKDPNYVWSYVRLGQINIENEKYSEAGDFLNKAIELDANFAPPYKYRGELFLKYGYYDKARDDLKKYVELAGNDQRARIQYASYMYINGQYDEAIQELEAVKQDTVTNLLRRILGMAYAKKGDVDKGISLMDEYFAEYKEEYHTATDYEEYAKMWLMKGDLDKADEYFAKEVEKNAERAVVYKDLATDYSKAGDAYDKEAKAAAKQVRYKQRQIEATYKQAEEKGLAVSEELDNKLKSELKTNQDLLDEKSAAALKEYQYAAHFQRLHLDKTEDTSLKGYYEMAKTYLDAKEFDLANEYFDKCIELKADWFPPRNYKFRVAYTRWQDAGESDEANATYLIPAADEIITYFETTEPSSKSETRALEGAVGIKIQKAYQADGTDNYGCAEVSELIGKLQAVGANISQYEELANFCNQQMSAQGGK